MAVGRFANMPRKHHILSYPDHSSAQSKPHIRLPNARDIYTLQDAAILAGKAIKATDSPRGAQTTLNFLNRLASDVQLMLRRPARMQYAALCYRIRKKTKALEILLITSRDTGRWVIPKGWPMQGKRAHEVAEREAYEEAGVKGHVQKATAGYYLYQKRMDHGLKISVKVQVHALEVDDLCKHFPEEGRRQLEWVDYKEAASRVAEPSLKDLILAFGGRMESAASPMPKAVNG